MKKNNNYEEKPLKGIELLLNRFYHEYGKLPMLEVIVQKFTHELSSRLRGVVQGVVEVHLNSFKSIKFQKIFTNLGKYYTIVVFKAVEWNTSSILIFNNSTVLSFLNIVFGGKKFTNTSDTSITEKNLTSIEQNIAKFLGEIILGSLSFGFKDVVISSFQIDNLENNYKFLNISNTEEYGVAMNFEVKIENLASSFFDIIFPYKSLEPIKTKLQKSFISVEDHTSTDIQESVLPENLESLEIVLECKINTDTKSLEEISNLKVNDVLVFEQGQHDLIGLYHQDIKIIEGSLGKRGNKVAIKISD